MKKYLGIILAISMLQVFYISAFAANSSDSNLFEIAENIIVSSEDIQDSGAVVTTYENIKTFVSEVHSQNPAITNLEIANFIADYTQQTPDSMPEDDLLSLLDYESISTSSEYIRVNDEGAFQEISESEALTAPLSDWTSSDGYMKLTTSYARQKIVNGEKYFAVWTSAKWLKSPKMCLGDVLVLGSSGTFDDTFTESGYVDQRFKCNLCNKYTNYDRDVHQNRLVDQDLEMKYDNYTPYLKFIPKAPFCNYCVGASHDDNFLAYLKYGVRTTSSCNIQAAYGHTILGIGNISVGISKDGKPSISAGPATTITPYNARPVTVS